MINLILVSLASLFVLVGGYKLFGAFDELDKLSKNVDNLESKIEERKQETKRLANIIFEEKKQNQETQAVKEEEDSKLEVLLAEKQKAENPDFSVVESKTETKEAELAALNEKKQGFNSKRPQLEELKETVDNLANATKESEELSRKLAFLEAKEESLTLQNKALDEKKNSIEKGESLPTLVAKVSSIDNTWNLIKINKGASAGVAAGSILGVYRSDEKVASLRVLALLNSSAIAELITDGTSKEVQIGDKVVSVLK